LRGNQKKYHFLDLETKKLFNQQRKEDPAKRRSRYANNAESRQKAIANSKANYAKLRQALIEGYGSKCVCCKELEPKFLTIDHINGGGNKHFNAIGAVKVYRQIVNDGFPKNYQLLCHNCNAGRQRNGGVCPHVKLDVEVGYWLEQDIFFSAAMPARGF